ncbi:MAG TPA: MOSC domain-containing protein [Candidatus Limnocylindrales bacterium]
MTATNRSTSPDRPPIVRGRVASVNTSPGGVPKRPVAGSLAVGRLGLTGDGHTEPEPMHGGPDQAVSLYAIESIARVAADGHAAFPGAYGENLTLEGVEMDALAAGDRLSVGEGGLLLELTKHAAPCQTIAHWFLDRAIARISPKVHPEDARWYARVLVEGPVAAGDRVEVRRG